MTFSAYPNQTIPRKNYVTCIISCVQVTIRKLYCYVFVNFPTPVHLSLQTWLVHFKIGYLKGHQDSKKNRIIEG